MNQIYSLYLCNLSSYSQCNKFQLLSNYYVSAIMSLTYYWPSHTPKKKDGVKDWIFVFPTKISMWKSYHSCDGIWRHGLWESIRFRWSSRGGSMMGLVLLEEAVRLHSFSAMWGYREVIWEKIASLIFAWVKCWNGMHLPGMCQSEKQPTRQHAYRFPCQHHPGADPTSFTSLNILWLH